MWYSLDMKRVVIQTRKFSQVLDSLIDQKKLLKEDFEAFERRLVANPDEGDVIQGTGGLRKTRLKASSKGKSGGFRVCYVDVPEKEKLFLILIYPKNVQEDLSKDEIKVLKSIVDMLRKE